MQEQPQPMGFGGGGTDEGLRSQLADKFLTFLRTFSKADAGVASLEDDDAHESFYSTAVRDMDFVKEGILHINFDHLNTYGITLARALQSHYYAIDGLLRAQLREFVVSVDPDMGLNADGNAAEYYIKFFNLTGSDRLRDLKVRSIYAWQPIAAFGHAHCTHAPSPLITHENICHFEFHGAW